MTVRALRGATTVDVDERSHIRDRVLEMLGELLDRNGLDSDDLISVLFTATADLQSVFPATVARELLPADLPLMCAQELDTEGSLDRCIRLMLHTHSSVPRSEVSHVFLHGAAALRPDLAKPVTEDTPA